MKEGKYSSLREEFEKDMLGAVKEYESSQPVIVMVENEAEAKRLEELLKQDPAIDLSLLTEISKIGEIRGRDMFY